MRHRRHAVAREQLRKQPHHHLAVFQHVRHARGHAQVVFQHVELALAGAHDVDAGDMRVDVARHVHAEHVGAVLGVVVDLVGRDQAGADDVLRVVDVVQETVERIDALAQAALERRPFAGREDARNDVERNGALGAAVRFVLVTVDREGDADAAEDQVGFGALVLQRRGRLVVQPFGEASVVAAHLALPHQCRRGRLGGMGTTLAMPAEHFIVEPDSHAVLPLMTPPRSARHVVFIAQRFCCPQLGQTRRSPLSYGCAPVGSVVSARAATSSAEDQ